MAEFPEFTTRPELAHHDIPRYFTICRYRTGSS